VSFTPGTLSITAHTSTSITISATGASGSPSGIIGFLFVFRENYDFSRFSTSDVANDLMQLTVFDGGDPDLAPQFPLVYEDDGLVSTSSYYYRVIYDDGFGHQIVSNQVAMIPGTGQATTTITGQLLGNGIVDGNGGV
jgi:hypothetical protein